MARLPLFQKSGDYEAFERVMHLAHERYPVRILSYCLMPNHWHMVLWPKNDGDLSAFLRWLTHTHTMRWHAHHHTSGSGHLYQGRFKSFPVETDEHFYTVVRYVERNALRDRLVRKAERWRWSSLWRREQGSDEQREILSPWPLPMPSDWIEIVQTPHTEAELEALRQSAHRGTPYGTEAWQLRTSKRLHLEHTLRGRGRPRNAPADAE